jgi:hypothetical protein
MQKRAAEGGEGRGEAEGKGGVAGEEEEGEEKGGGGGGNSEVQNGVYEQRKSGIEQGEEVEEEHEIDGEGGEEGDAKEEEVQGEKGAERGEGQEGQEGSEEDVEEGDEKGSEAGEEGGQFADRPAAKRFKFLEVLFILTLYRKCTRGLLRICLLRICCEGCVEMRRPVDVFFC